MRERLHKCICMGVMVLMLSISVVGDRLDMVDGSVIWGLFIGSTAESIDFEFIGGVARFDRRDVLRVTFTDRQISAPTEFISPIPVYGTPPVSVGGGTRIVVRLIDGLSSQIYGPGTNFTAVMVSDLVGEGLLLAPAGTVVTGRIAGVRTSRQRAGRGWLRLELTSITIGGIAYNIQTEAGRALSVRVAARAARRERMRTRPPAMSRGTPPGLNGPIQTSGRRIEVPPGALLEFELSYPFVYAP